MENKYSKRWIPWLEIIDAINSAIQGCFIAIRQKWSVLDINNERETIEQMVNNLCNLIEYLNPKLLERCELKIQQAKNNLQKIKKTYERANKLNDFALLGVSLSELLEDLWNILRDAIISLESLRGGHIQE